MTRSRQFICNRRSVDVCGFIILPIFVAFSVLFLQAQPQDFRPIVSTPASLNSRAERLWAQLEGQLAKLYSATSPLPRVDETTENILSKMLFDLGQAEISPAELKPLMRRDFGGAAAQQLSNLLNCYETYKQHENHLRQQMGADVMLDLRPLQGQLFGPETSKKMFHFYFLFYENLETQHLNIKSVDLGAAPIHDSCVAVQAWQW